MILRFGRYGAAALLGMALVLLNALPAFAHVELVSSHPRSGSVVSESPDTIELQFSVAAVPAGAGIVLVDAQGAEPLIEVEQPTDDLIVLRLVDPLETGDHAVMWTMKAGDAHPKSGIVEFRVEASGSSIGGTDGAPVSEVPDETSESFAVVAVFSEPSSAIGDWLSRVGRWGAMLGTLVGVGAFAFAATSLVGTRREVRQAGYWIRRAGVLVLLGTVAEVLGISMATIGSVVGGFSPQSTVDVMSGSFGVAVLLRVAGGVAMVQGARLHVIRAEAPVADPMSIAWPDRIATTQTDTIARPVISPSFRLDLAHSGTALLGAALVVASYLFDGHTVTAAPAPIVRLANVTHVTAAGVWLGGVLLMGSTLSSRHRRSTPLGAAAMAVRFSRVASVALAVVGVAGIALTWAILESPMQLLSTPWGRFLLVKLALVGTAVGIGAFNHFKVVPFLGVDTGEDVAALRLRMLVRIEGAVLLVVVAVTAVFVGLAS